jgi:hypothetical protein
VTEVWLRVCLPYATFAVAAEADEGIITEAPPIARWMVSRDKFSVGAWIAKRGGTWEFLDDQ